MQRTKFVLAALMTGGLSGAILIGELPPAEAAGTAAGTAISNTATATYSDPNNPGTTLNATSKPSPSRWPKSRASLSAAACRPTPRRATRAISCPAMY